METLEKILELSRSKQLVVQEELSRRLRILNEIVTDDTGPWSYGDLVGQLIDKAGESEHGYPAHPVDVMIKDHGLTLENGSYYAVAAN